MEQYSSPVYIDQLVGYRIKHKNPDYGSGIISAAYFIFDSNYNENRLKIKIHFDNAHPSTYFDLEKCLRTGLLKCPEFKNTEADYSLLAECAQEEYRKEQEKQKELERQKEQEKQKELENRKELENQKRIQRDSTQEKVENQEKTIHIIPPQKPAGSPWQSIWNTSFYNRIRPMTSGNMLDLEREIQQKNRNAYLQLDKRNNDTAFMDNRENLKKLLSVLKENGFQYFHHHTDMSNFINIMKTGMLYSRADAPDFKNGAELSVISHTPDFVKESVRFYFKEKTPTFFRNEGIFREISSENEGHVPLPVALLFDEKLLEERGTAISDGNAGTTSTLITPFYSAAIHFDWKTIFARGKHDPDPDITRKRNAEFLFPHQVEISKAKIIGFRSMADYKHAIAVLGPDPRFAIRTELFELQQKNNPINYLLDYEVRKLNNQLWLHVYFRFNPSGFRQTLKLFYKDGTIEQIQHNSNEERTPRFSLPPVNSIEHVEFLINENVCAYWREK